MVFLSKNSLHGEAIFMIGVMDVLLKKQAEFPIMDVI